MACSGADERPGRRGSDLFVLETFADLEELELALAVAAQLDLPAVAQMAFFEGRTHPPNAATESSPPPRRRRHSGDRRLTAARPRSATTVLQHAAAVVTGPCPRLRRIPAFGRRRPLHLPGHPDYFASMGREMVEAGASLVGGCCGPEHIRALSRRLGVHRPA
ncbi:MAG: homocysteine S-methyltransferase family protein [Syntrophotaleaceae bacterium]